MPAERKGGDGAVHAPRHLSRTTLLAAVVATAFAAAIVAPTARADGDPASDYLLAQKVFFPFDAKFPAKQQAQFAGLVEDANRAGFKVRVALISSSYDMGSVTSLYRKPRTYARFLGQELAFVYKQRLLVVMANGFGFNWPGHPSALAYKVLAKIPINPGNAGLLSAAQTAVQRLAAADGVHVAAPTNVTTPAQRTSHDRLIIIAAAVAAVLLAAAARFALRRRRSQPMQHR
jgi:hypothetical protein